MIIDIWSEATFDSICGRGFSAGNCFLIDGLGVFLYIYIVPVFLVSAVIILNINLVRKIS